MVSQYRIQSEFDQEDMRTFLDVFHETSSNEGVFQPLDFTLTTSWREAAEKASYASAIRYIMYKNGKPVGLFQGLVQKKLFYKSLLAGSTSGNGIAMLKGSSLNLMKHFLLQILKREKFSAVSIFVPTPASIPGFSEKANYTLYIHLNRDIDELFKKMEKKTRNRVRKARKLGVTVDFSTSQKALREAYNVIHHTSAMKSISAFPWRYTVRLHECFQGNGCESMIALGYAGGEAVQSAAHLIGFDKKIILWQAGSTEKGYKLNVGSLLQAEIMEHSKNSGYLIYDMGGTDPNDPIYAGIHRFKSGFGGSLIANQIVSRNAFYVPIFRRAYSLFMNERLRQVVHGRYKE
jgi:hypothetical protein